MPEIIERLESNVRSYCRSFPAVLARAAGSSMFDIEGRAYLDFFCGAGTLSYGHDEPFMREHLLAYIAQGGIVHALDMTTEAKCAFLDAFERTILAPRGLAYRLMFPSPTGTNAVEAALKLARKVTGRTSVIAFTNAYHGMTLGALAVSGNRMPREAAGVALHHVIRAPFDGYLGPGVDSLAHLEAMLDDPSSGLEPPAAIIVETVQAEGGVNVASGEWLTRLQALAHRHGALFVVDDVQVGCGRTGAFFSFEAFGLRPDVVCLSKALSGYGLPLALVLIRPELDRWQPGEHNGTFRGNNLAFVTARAALERFWADDALTLAVERKATHVRARLAALAERCGGRVRGRGLIQGLALDHAPALARAASREAFARGLIVETCGARGQVLKLLPALTIDDAELARGLDILESAVLAVHEASP